MNQRRNGRQMMMIGIGVIVLVLAAGLFFLNRGGGSSNQSAAVSNASVVVALQSVPQGTTFSAGQPLNTYFTVKQVPKSVVPFGAYTSLNQLASFMKSTGCQPTQNIGCRETITATQTIYQNLPVVAGMFSSLGQFRVAAGPAFQIPYGYVGMSISLNDVNSVSGSIQPGDDIDLMASYTGGESTSDSKLKQTQYVMNDLRVIGVGGPPPAPAAPTTGGKPAASASTSSTNSASGGSLMVLVRYQQALILQHLKDFGGSWTMSAVLRSAKETDIPHFRTTPVSARWFFVKQDNHFDFKLPY